MQIDVSERSNVFTVYVHLNGIHTLRMSRTDAAVQVEAPVHQDAVVLQPHVLVLVQLMKQPKTLGVFHSQRGQISVVSGDIHPHVVLK